MNSMASYDVASNVCRDLPPKALSHRSSISSSFHVGPMRSAKPQSRATAAAVQGLTFVHFSAQRKRFLWDRECI